MGNVLGSCVFNSLAVMGVASEVGRVTADKRVSRWEGPLLLLPYGLFIMEVARLV